MEGEFLKIPLIRYKIRGLGGFDGLMNGKCGFCNSNKGYFGYKKECGFCNTLSVVFVIVRCGFCNT
jgi:hypothetical protein